MMPFYSEQQQQKTFGHPRQKKGAGIRNVSNMATRTLCLCIPAACDLDVY